MGLAESEIQKQLSAITGKSQKELKDLMQQAVDKALTEDAKIYAAAGIKVPDPMAVAGVKTMLSTGMQQTTGLFRNLTRTTANTATKQFENALDRAWLQINSGAFDYNTAVKNAVKELSKEGVRAVTYPSGHTDSLETAVRRAVITGVNQAASKCQMALMDESGADLVEVTAHSGARPSHAEWQGKIFSRSGTSKKYKNFYAVTGYGTGDGLCGWNCSHSFYPYFEGAPHTYSKKQLKEYNAATYEYNGKKLTGYEALQQQRSIERQIRRWKREETVMNAAGLSTDEAKAKVAAWQAVQRDFIHQTGLTRDYFRERAGAQYLETVSKDDIIKAQLRNAGIKGKIHMPPRQIEVDSLSYDENHINAEREHGVSHEEAKSFILNAKFSNTVWKGMFENYYSYDGVAYVNLGDTTIRTAFFKEHFDTKTKKYLEVLKNNGK